MPPNSCLEITDKEYLIKLPKEEFDLSFIHQLVKRIQSEQFFFPDKNSDFNESIEDKNTGTQDLLRFDSLHDK